MAGNPQITPIDSTDGEFRAAPLPVHTEAETGPASEDWWVEDSPRRVRDWRGGLAVMLAVGLAVGWTAFFVWANRKIMLAPASPLDWIGWISDWALPLVLLACLWLIAMRNSTREAARFGQTASALADESARLEVRLATINSELSLAREFIAAQARDLDSLGRVAGERLTEHAERLNTLIGENASRIDAIGTVSDAALDNMEKLRGQLPVIASAAKDVTNNIGSAGRMAHTQLEDLITGFTRLNSFGQASERQVIALRDMVDSTLGEFSSQAAQLGELSEARFAALTERGAEFRAQLDNHEIEALASIRTRARALSEELVESAAALSTQEAESLASLRARLNAVRDESASMTRAVRDGETAAVAAWQGSITRLEADLAAAVARISSIDQQALESARKRLDELTLEAETLDTRFAERDRHFTDELTQRQVAANARHSEHVGQLAGLFADLDQQVAARLEQQQGQVELARSRADTLSVDLERFAARMADVAAMGGAAEAQVAASLVALTDQLAASREALTGTDIAIAELTDGSVRLLELIQGSVKQSSEDLPKALDITEARLAAVEERAIALRDVASASETHGARLSDYVLASAAGLTATNHDLKGLHHELTLQQGDLQRGIEGLRRSLTALDAQSQAVATQAEGALVQSITLLTDKAQVAVAAIESGSAAAISALAQRLGEESGKAIEAAMRERTADAAGQLEQAALSASAVSREAAIQLRDQLAKVSELASNLERRVAHARSRAEEQVDNDFARRVALITEGLNSNAIDIARVLDTDVTDTAWASYLKGDRGIFTRRAVRLLDAGEAKAVIKVYEDDADFRDHVSRYIHDFEAMLRQLLSTRDGHALGVTLLSSDMGKLYVALAQAIERLRN